ncbi:MAG: HEAT repeat domain-containing protein [Planctomycetota bacterium]
MKQLLTNSNDQGISFLGDKAYDIALALIEKGNFLPHEFTIRSKAIELIGKMRDDRTLPYLIRIFAKSDANGRLETLTAAAHSRLRGVDYAPLTRLGLRDEDPSVRNKALLLIGRSPGLSEAELAGVLADPVATIRVQAFRSAINNQAVLGPDRLAELALADADPAVRILVFAGYDTWQSLLAQRPELIDRGLEDTDDNVRAAAYRALSRVASPSRYRPAARRGLGDSSPEVRDHCIELLSRDPSPEDVRALVPLLADPSRSCSESAAGALRQTSAEDLVAAAGSEALFVAGLNSPGDSVATLCYSVLARVGSRELLPRFREALFRQENIYQQAGLYFIIRHDAVEAMNDVLDRLPSLGSSGLNPIPQNFQYPPEIRGRSNAAWVLNWIALREHRDAFRTFLERSEGIDLRQTDSREAMVLAVRRLVSDGERESVCRRLGTWPDVGSQLLTDLDDWIPDAPWVEAFLAERVEASKSWERLSFARLLGRRATTAGGGRLVDLIARAESPSIAEPMEAALSRVMDAALAARVAGIIDGRPDADLAARYLRALAGSAIPEAGNAIHDLVASDRLETPNLRQVALEALADRDHPDVVELTLASMRKYADTVPNGNSRPRGPTRLQLLGAGEARVGPESDWSVGLTVLHRLPGKRYLEIAETIFRDRSWSPEIRAQAILLLGVTILGDDFVEEDGQRRNLKDENDQNRKGWIATARDDEDAVVRRAGIHATGHLLMFEDSFPLRGALTDPETAAAANAALLRFAQFGFTLTR